MHEKSPLATLAQLGAAIRRAREAKGYTLDVVSRATTISKPYLSNIETARAPGPPSDAKLVQLEQLLDFTPGTLVQAAHWIRTPESIRAKLTSLTRRPDGTLNLDALIPQALTSPPPAAPAPSEALTLKHIPLINRVPAGKPMEYTDLGYPTGVADHYIPAPSPASPNEAQPSFALRVTGDSMEPDYHDGDIIILAATEPRDGDDCLIRLDETENFATTFKRISFIYNDLPTSPPTHARLLPLNPRYPARTFPMENISGIYPVLWKMTRPSTRLPSPAPPSGSHSNA